MRLNTRLRQWRRRKGFNFLLRHYMMVTTTFVGGLGKDNLARERIKAFLDYGIILVVFQVNRMTCIIEFLEPWLAVRVFINAFHPLLFPHEMTARVKTFFRAVLTTVFMMLCMYGMMRRFDRGLQYRRDT